MTSFCDIFCPLLSLFNVEVVIPEAPLKHQDAFIWQPDDAITVGQTSALFSHHQLEFWPNDCAASLAPIFVAIYLNVLRLDIHVIHTPQSTTLRMVRISSSRYLCVRLLKQHLAPLLYSSKRGDHSAAERQAPVTYLGVNPVLCIYDYSEFRSEETDSEIATMHPQASGIPTGPRDNGLRTAMGTLQTWQCLRGRAEAVLAPGSGPLTNSSESDHDHPNIIGLVRRAVANRHGLSAHVMGAALARDDYHNRPTTSSASPHVADPC
ncbi:uncharacterized protein SCHCODRAFT_01172554 [Schizophyllum commune H4-8]|nr:uncharacterized protein SCHCODRAFT_01172554 [Schizophyllum commune H4-8]KAI5891676.1 hypothetical protein SCHCODRAFT_01172554 [Schizophyllum commune H4-8]